MLNTEENSRKEYNCHPIRWKGFSSRRREISRKSRTSFLSSFHSFYSSISRVDFTSARQPGVAICTRLPASCSCLYIPLFVYQPLWTFVSITHRLGEVSPRRRSRNFSANILALIGAIGRRSAIITYRVRKIISQRVTGTPFGLRSDEPYNGFILARYT